MPVASIQVSSFCQPSHLKPKFSLSYLTIARPWRLWRWTSRPTATAPSVSTLSKLASRWVGGVDNGIYIQHRSWPQMTNTGSATKSCHLLKPENKVFFCSCCFLGVTHPDSTLATPPALKDGCQGWKLLIIWPALLLNSPPPLFRHSTCPVCRQTLGIGEEEEEMGYDGGDEALDDDDTNE